MDVEIRTLDGETWVTTVARDELPDPAPGAAAKHVEAAIKAGEPIRVARLGDDATRVPLRSRRMLMIFNPGTVIGVAEDDTRRRAF